MPAHQSRDFTVLLVLCSFLLLVGFPLQADANATQVDSASDWVDACTDWDDWDKPGPPFRVFGNSYYVGTCGISAILITGDEGHILIDGGTEAGADLIVENIRALGFSIDDVKLLLHSHEHFDHVAGLAKLQKLSGANLLASPDAAPALRTGMATDDDPQAGMHEPFPAARVDGIVDDGEIVNLGDLVLTPIATPGHTPGALSWQWTSCEDDLCVSVVYADSLSPISSDDYSFSDHPEYVEAFRAGLQRLAGLDCELLLTPHPSASGMRDRLSSSNGLVDSEGCAAYSKKISERLDARLEKERSSRLVNGDGGY